MPLLYLLVVGFLLGIRHATDADHVVAVTTIVSRERSLRSAAPIGAWRTYPRALLSAGWVSSGGGCFTDTDPLPRAMSTNPPTGETMGTVPYRTAHNATRPQGSYREGMRNMSAPASIL